MRCKTMRSLISFLKILSFVLVFLITIPIQAVWILLFNRSPKFYSFITVFGKIACSIFNIKVRVEGEPKLNEQTIFVGNHLSYIDIIVLGSFLNATFVAKADVARWPLFGLLARISQTVFITRNRDEAPKALENIKSSIAQGRSLIIFPEGTSTKGTEVLPFKSSLFDLFLQDGLKDNIKLQGFTMNIIEANGKKVAHEDDHDVYAWYADMTLLPHLWALGKSKGVTIKITFHPPRAASQYTNRKKFALDCHYDVAKGLQAP